MRRYRWITSAFIALALAGTALSQQGSKHVLSSDELKKAVPSEFFFRGQKAPVQLRNAAGFQAADGKMMWSTEATEARKDISYAGLPAVAGKYAYSIAIFKTGALALIGLSLSRVVRERIQQVGFVVVILLMVFVLTNDILKQVSISRSGGSNAPVTVPITAPTPTPAPK